MHKYINITKERSPSMIAHPWRSQILPCLTLSSSAALPHPVLQDIQAHTTPAPPTASHIPSRVHASSTAHSHFIKPILYQHSARVSSIDGQPAVETPLCRCKQPPTSVPRFHWRFFIAAIFLIGGATPGEVFYKVVCGRVLILGEV
jgi:hypothetical protein